MQLGWCDTALILPYAAIQIFWPGIADRSFDLLQISYVLTKYKTDPVQVRPKARAGLVPCPGWSKHLSNLLCPLPPLLHAWSNPHWSLLGPLLAGLH